MPIKTLSNLRGDLFGGLTAAVVALPLALAFGVASGAGAIAGLYGAIAVGFFASIFGGTRAQVSGPTGPMTVVMAAVVALYADNLPEAFGIVILGGAFQVVFGLLRVGRFVSYTPYSVVSGFMSGIGIIIIVIQTLPFFGIETAPGGPLGSMRAWPEPGNRGGQPRHHDLLAKTGSGGSATPAGSPDPRHADERAVTAQRTGHRRGTNRIARSGDPGLPDGRPAEDRPGGACAGAPRFDRQPVDIACGGFDHPHPAQIRPRADRPGHRQHGRRADRRLAGRGCDNAHGDQCAPAGARRCPG
jgi:hypothetical protein